MGGVPPVIFVPVRAGRPYEPTARAISAESGANSVDESDDTPMIIPVGFFPNNEL
jgi:hypothetical protein